MSVTFEQDAEMDRNFEAFRKLEPTLPQEHTGKYGLKRHGRPCRDLRQGR
jgi:hypothetical protein